MKKILPVLLLIAFILSLTACDKKGTQEAPSVPAAPEAVSETNTVQTEEESAFEQLGDIEVDKGLFNVTITFPASFIGEDMTQEKLGEAIKDEDGIKSATLNADGSATYVMTKAKHQEMIDDTKKTIDDALQEMINDESMSITDIKANADYTKFTVTVSTEEVGLSESFSVIALYSYGGMYGIITGKEVDNIQVDFVNKDGKVISTANSKDMGE